jgi:hypothetical protein
MFVGKGRPPAIFAAHQFPLQRLLRGVVETATTSPPATRFRGHRQLQP